MPRILAATRDGLHSLDADGHRIAVGHPGRSVTAIVRDGPELWAIVDRSEVWYAPTGQWRLIASLESHTATCIAMTDAIHVGTSEARLFRLEGTALESVASFDAVEGGPPGTRPGAGPLTRGRSPNGAPTSM
jgi:hypothetical protein